VLINEQDTVLKICARKRNKGREAQSSKVPKISNFQLHKFSSILEMGAKSKILTISGAEEKIKENIACRPLS